VLLGIPPWGKLSEEVIGKLEETEHIMCTTTAAGNELGLTDKNHACTCGRDSHAESTPPSPGDAIRAHYLVDGMTCSDGVHTVSVDLNAGGTSRIMVVSSAPVPAADIRAAVTAAGYALVTG
jgi:copper chaperone